MESSTLSKRLVTLSEASEILSLSIPTLRAAIYRGELRTVRLCARGHIRIELSEIDKLIQRSRREHVVMKRGPRRKKNVCEPKAKTGEPANDEAAR